MADLLDYGELGRAVWAALAEGASDESHALHLVTLATVGSDGRPSARTMALRGIDRGSGSVFLHADGRSPKIGELRGNGCACLLALDKDRGIQVRLAGRAMIHEHDALADDHWHGAARLRTAWWQHEVIPVRRAAHLPATFERMPATMTRQAREHFTVIEVCIDHIDWFQSEDGRVRCAVLKRAEGWATRIVPP